MRTIEQWFEEYGVSHKNQTNIKIHKVCVPLITWSLLGMMWMIPVPSFMKAIHLNFAYVFMILAYAFYFSLKSVKLIIAMSVLVAPVIIFFEMYANRLGMNLLYGSIIVFVISWAGQFIGHKIEGKKPSFLEDVQFLLIGPGWCLNDLFKIVK